MTAAATRLWVPNLWLPRTEFRLRRTRDATDNRILSGADVGSMAESFILDQGSGPVLPIGGNHALRGVKAFSFQTADQIVVGTSQAEIHAAIAAAPTNGVVRLPNAVVYPGFNLTKPITVEVNPNATTGTVVFAAPDCTVEGGIVRNIFASRAAAAPRGTVRNVRVTSTSGFGVELQGGVHADWHLSQTEFAGQTLDFIKLWYDQAADPDLLGFRIEHSILARTAGTAVSGIAGADGNNLNVIKDFVAHNCYMDFGTDVQGHFGIEVWGHETNALGKGGIVEYCDLRGGQVLLSMVRSRDSHIHHNLARTGPGAAFAFYESGGPNHTRALIEDNEMIGARRFVYHNSGSHHNTVRRNKAPDAFMLVGDAEPTGGGYIVEDNCVNDPAKVIAPTGWGIANTNTNNGPTGCGF